MIKKVYIDGLFMALSYEATKVFIKKNDVYIKFKEDLEENKEILELVQGLGIDKVIGDYTISIDFEFMVLEIHKKYDFKVLRKLGKDDIEKIWTITMVEIDQLMTKEAKE
ncbi:hypothetical protein [Fusobacterium animalis]|uniref:hypothetical protein n=1 Tax=Fusobacterium animalis TaxID=76859 RepID=UPI0035592B7E